MIIGKSITAPSGGLKPEICVTAKAGALLNLHFKDSDIILQSYQLGEYETQHTFIVSINEIAYVIEDVTNMCNEEVLINSVSHYNVEIDRLYLYNEGNECIDITGGWEFDYIDNKYGTSVTEKREDCIYVKTTAKGVMGAGCNAKTVKYIDLTPYTKIYFDVAMKHTDAYDRPYLLLRDSNNNRITLYTIGASQEIPRTIIESDISSVTGLYAPLLFNGTVLSGKYGEITMYRCWLT